MRPLKTIGPWLFTRVCDLKAQGEGARKIGAKTGLNSSFVSVVMKECGNALARARRTGTSVETVNSESMTPPAHEEVVLPRLNEVISPGLLPDLSLSSHIQLPDSVDPSYEFVEEVDLQNANSLRFSPRVENFSSMLSGAMNDVL